MRRLNTRQIIALSVICFGAGIFLSFLLPGYLLAFIEAAVIIAAGILLLWKRI